MSSSEESPLPTAQRTATRAPVKRTVQLQFDGATDALDGICQNVSIGGMFVALDAPCAEGSLVRFEMALGEQRSVRGLGEVRWCREQATSEERPAGFGIQFRFLEAKDRQQIFRLVSQHIKERLEARHSAMGNGRGAPTTGLHGPAATETVQGAGTGRPATKSPVPKSPVPEQLHTGTAGAALEGSERTGSKPAFGSRAVVSSRRDQGQPLRDDAYQESPSSESRFGIESDPADGVFATGVSTSSRARPQSQSGPAEKPWTEAEEPSRLEPQSAPASERELSRPLATPLETGQAVDSELPGTELPAMKLPDMELPAMELPGPELHEPEAPEPELPEPELQQAVPAAAPADSPTRDPDEHDPAATLLGEDDELPSWSGSVDEEDRETAQWLDQQLQPEVEIVTVREQPQGRGPRLVQGLALLLALALVVSAVFWWLGRNPASEEKDGREQAGSVEAGTSAQSEGNQGSAPGDEDLVELAPARGADGRSPAVDEARGGSAAANEPEDGESSAAAPADSRGDSVAGSSQASNSGSSEGSSSAPSPAAETAGVEPETGFGRIERITWQRRSRDLLVTLRADGPVRQGRYRHFRLEGGEPREVIRLRGVRAAYPEPVLEVGDPWLRRIRVGYHRKPNGNELHVVMDLANPAIRVSSVQVRGQSLEVVLEEP